MLQRLIGDADVDYSTREINFISHSSGHQQKAQTRSQPPVRCQVPTGDSDTWQSPTLARVAASLTQEIVNKRYQARKKKKKKRKPVLIPKPPPNAAIVQGYVVIHKKKNKKRKKQPTKARTEHRSAGLPARFG